MAQDDFLCFFSFLLKKLSGGEYHIKELRVNEKIRTPEIRVIDENGSQLGVLASKEAIQLAKEKGLDLVEVSPNTAPPVCKIMDYGKYKYEQKKKNKGCSVKRKIQELKEIIIRPKIDDHDYQVKCKTVKRLIEEGFKVKITMRFKGRETMFAGLDKKVMERFVEETQDLTVVEKPLVMEGRNMIVVLAPSPKKTK